MDVHEGNHIRAPENFAERHMDRNVCLSAVALLALGKAAKDLQVRRTVVEGSENGSLVVVLLLANHTDRKGGYLGEEVSDHLERNGGGDWNTEQRTRRCGWDDQRV